MPEQNQHKELLAQARTTVQRLTPVDPLTLEPDSLSALDYARGLLDLFEQLEAARPLDHDKKVADVRWAELQELRDASIPASEPESA